MSIPVRLGITERLMNATDLEPRRGESVTMWRVRVGAAVAPIVEGYVVERLARLDSVYVEVPLVRDLSDSDLRDAVQKFGEVMSHALLVLQAATAETMIRASRAARLQTPPPGDPER